MLSKKQPFSLLHLPFTCDLLFDCCLPTLTAVSFVVSFKSASDSRSSAKVIPVNYTWLHCGMLKEEGTVKLAVGHFDSGCVQDERVVG